MHYHAQIWLPRIEDVHAQVERLMEPHREWFEGSKSGGFWDWWQIGGRYTGRASTYDPEQDERNYERCDMCGGTGFRSDALGVMTRARDPSYTCNGCGTYVDGKWAHGKYGPGVRLKWPTDWVDVPQNVIHVEAVPDDLKCYTFIAGDTVLHTEKWDGKDWLKTEFDGSVKSALDKLGIKGGYLVTVDYHS